MTPNSELGQTHSSGPFWVLKGIRTFKEKREEMSDHLWFPYWEIQLIHPYSMGNYTKGVECEQTNIF